MDHANRSTLPATMPRSSGGSPWMKATEAAAYLGLASVKALYQAVRRGDVPARRLGARRMRFHRAELDDVLLRRG